MEVVGLVAAIPGLIDIIQKTISLIRACSDLNSVSKQIKELLDQLESIERILRDIVNRLKSSSRYHSNFNRLNNIARSLKGELTGLAELFQPLKAGPGRKAKILGRARLFIHGLEGKIKKYNERLDKAKSSLALEISALSEEIAEESLAASRSSLRLELHRALILPEYNFDFIPQNLQSTCQWIWSHPVFCEWQKDSACPSPNGHERRIMCIYGPKGCGKSVLAASIAKELKLQPDFAVSFFSFWASCYNQRKLLAFLRVFLWHIIQKIPDDDLAQISAPVLKSLPLTEGTLENAVVTAIKSIKSPVYCIIDGIDESVDDWARPGTGGLRLVLNLVKAHPKLRLILLGRDASMWPAIRLTPLSIEIKEELIRPDLNQLILHHLDSSLSIQDSATRQLVQKTLQESSRIMFLWATLIFGELKRCQFPNEIERTLRQVPRDLDREYHRLFTRLQDRLGGARKSPSLSMERAKCLLSWIIAAPEPLTYEELRSAFAISHCPDEGYDRYMISEDGIMDTCGDFIRVSDGHYHMAHTSIAEFLTRPIADWQHEDETIDYFCVDVLQSQNLMCIDCINYFQRTDLGYPLTDSSIAMSHMNLPIFSCALKFALIYLIESEHDERVWEYFENFVRTSRFCSLVECGLFILQNESAASSEPHGELIRNISRAFSRALSRALSQASSIERFDRLFILMPLLETTFKRELARREEVFGPDNDRSRTWKSFVDVLIAPQGGRQMLPLGLHNVKENNQSQDAEMASGNHLSRPHQAMKTEARRAAEHTAMLKIGEIVAAKAPVLQALTRIVVPSFTSIVPELLPIPFLILLALRETNRVRRERYLSIALKRLTGANNFFEAFCAVELGMSRYWKDNKDETVEELLHRCRKIAVNLPPSLHVDILHCNTLRCLVRLLVKRSRLLEAQKTILELQQQFSKGPTRGYISTPLERKMYRPFWDIWEAEVWADIARSHAWQYSDAFYTGALSIVDSNIHLFQNPGHWGVGASIMAHYAKAEALYRKWHNKGGKIPCELARESEAACRVALELANFPNSAKYVKEQWRVLNRLCCLLHSQYRYHEARELISRTAAHLPPTPFSLSIIGVAATAAFLGNLDIGEAIFDRASLKIQGQQVALLQSQSKHIANLIAALVKVRPIVRLWLPVSLHYSFESKRMAKALHERNLWYEDAISPDRFFNRWICELWDILYIRYLALISHDSGDTRNVTIYVRSFRHEIPGYTYKRQIPQYEDASEDEESKYEEDASESGEGSCAYAEFAFGCEELAFKYAQKKNYEAAAVVSRYLILYALKRNPGDSFQWSLYYTALSLYFTFKGEEALALCRSMLLWAEKCAPLEDKWWGYTNTAIACFKIGRDHAWNGNKIWIKFLLLAAVSFTRARNMEVPSTDKGRLLRWLRESQYVLKEKGIVMDSLEATSSSHINSNIRDRDGILRYQSCPDLRAGYVKEVQSHRTAYNLSRKQSVKPIARAE
ncbi:hypothetical protein F5Y10DRAFT_284128 [Nemania abortiva]|nr:hypothetical protein F5Y10DRAFT_284128 [Nemania abortiva]